MRIARGEQPVRRQQDEGKRAVQAPDRLRQRLVRRRAAVLQRQPEAADGLRVLRRAAGLSALVQRFAELVRIGQASLKHKRGMLGDERAAVSPPRT